jgi:hypothetical protein
VAKLSDRDWLWLWSTLSALAWGAAHLAIHLPRGWPFDVRGEWDLLVTAQAIAAGQAPPVALGAVGGTELGSYLVATTMGAGMALGIDGVLVGKLLALAVGAGTAALITGWAWWLASAVSGRGGSRRCWTYGDHSRPGLAGSTLRPGRCDGA